MRVSMIWPQCNCRPMIDVPPIAFSELVTQISCSHDLDPRCTIRLLPLGQLRHRIALRSETALARNSSLLASMLWRTNCCSVLIILYNSFAVCSLLETGLRRCLQASYSADYAYVCKALPYTNHDSLYFHSPFKYSSLKKTQRTKSLLPVSSSEPWASNTAGLCPYSTISHISATPTSSQSVASG